MPSVTVFDGDYHEVVLSTHTHGVSRWLHVDLPHRVDHLGVPVTTVVATTPSLLPLRDAQATS